MRLIDADVVPVVRCEKCMYCHEAHYENPGEPPYIKRRCTNKYAMANSGYAVLEDGFCSYGERDNKNAAGDCDIIVADVKPVVHGHWFVKRFGDDAQCSECGWSFADAYDADSHDRFCRHCGIEMCDLVLENKK